MYAIFVTINVKPESIEAFADASLGDGQGSTRDEAGCFRFDILKNPNVVGRFHLYEVYLNEDAFDTHRTTPHFQKWWATVENMLDGGTGKGRDGDRLSIGRRVASTKNRLAQLVAVSKLSITSRATSQPVTLRNARQPGTALTSMT